MNEKFGHFGVLNIFSLLFYLWLTMDFVKRSKENDDATKKCEEKKF